MFNAREHKAEPQSRAMLRQDRRSEEFATQQLCGTEIALASGEACMTPRGQQLTEKACRSSNETGAEVTSMDNLGKGVEVVVASK